MIGADYTRKRIGYERGHRDVVCRLGVLGNEDIARRKLKASDFGVGSSRFHERNVMGDLFVFIHIRIIAETNRCLALNRLLVNATQSDINEETKPPNAPIVP